MSERYLYMNGRLVPYSEATIHVQSNAVKYGTSVFEGVRAYATLGEMAGALRDVFGEHKEPVRF